MSTLKGRLLVALPVLRDRNFDRTVVYVIEHSADGGALGVVLNRPSPLPLAEPLPKWEPMTPDPQVIFIGGPVGAGDAIALGDSADGLSIVDLETDPEDAGVDRVRVYAGYAGWTGGQLEDEIAAGAWIVVDATAADVMTSDPEDLWPRVLRRQGGRIAAVASFPDDPSLN
jgi:putative transcriptional regulator